jgi:hypothetical protein
MNTVNGKIVVKKMTSQEILEMIENLDQSEREKLLNKLNPSMTIIFGGSNLVSNGAAVQINASSEDLDKSLEKIPPEALGEFLKALGVYIAKNRF